MGKRRYKGVNVSESERECHYKGNYGNEAAYLTARIARDRPDIRERMKAGEYASVRAAAIDAGIPHVVRDSAKEPNRACERIARAWDRSADQRHS
jgi:hypothetical protein